MTDQQPLRLGSLCTGYGGLDMAVQAVFGGHLAWVADNDPGAPRILTHHHPQVPNLGDLTAVDWQRGRAGRRRPGRLPLPALQQRRPTEGNRR